MDRRDFIHKVVSGGTMAALYGTPLVSNALKIEQRDNELRTMIQSPLAINNVELHQWKKNQHFVVVTSKEGIRGITFCNNRMHHLYGIFKDLIAPFFTGKDARDIRSLVDDIYREDRNYKFSGMPFWNCVGHVEVAIWDLLGKYAQKPVYSLLGEKLRSEIPIYLSSLTRDNSAEEEVEKLLHRLHESGARAVKIKVGGRMKSNSTTEKRSQSIVALLRKHGPNDLVLYADANGSYDVKGGIEIGLFLESHAVDILEEPCPWEDFESNKKVAEVLTKIKLAGGEQDTSFHKFKWYCTNKALDVLQPDIFYNGGIERTLRIGQLAEQFSLGFAPHSPKSDPLEAAFLHVAAVSPALYGYQEFPASAVGKPSRGWFSPSFVAKDGKLNVPESTGLGIQYDEQIWKETRVV